MASSKCDRFTVKADANEGREMDTRAGETAEAVARRSYGKLVAFLAARTRNVAAAEDALAEAFAAALVDWPKHGVPDNPEAWLLTAARRKFLNSVRHARVEDAASDHLQMLSEELSVGTDAEIPDQRLALMFACAHPAIDPAIRAPLILQTVLGLDAARIASAFLISPATMGQRLVRAKAKIREAHIPFSVPAQNELPPRLDDVLAAIYAAYAEGWNDAHGADAARRDLAEEAIWLGSLVAEMMPGEAEALGLLALMLYAEARRGARRNASGEFVPLDEQDPANWNAEMIARAEAILLDASKLNAVGRYQLEAALQSAHIDRRHKGDAEWVTIVRLYDALLSLSGSPVVALNRALAIAETEGAETALEIVDALEDPRLKSYQPYWAAKATLLTRTGAYDSAREAFDLAIGLEHDPAVRRFLQMQKAKLDHACL
jgi:RNA polymerase sigma-70 factor (ECF subfamily)